MTSGVRSSVGVRREGRELLLEVPLATGRAVQAIRAIPYELLELITAVFTQVFKDRHKSLHKR